MTQSISFDNVSVLLPSRIHRSRRQHAGQLTADLSAWIEALPTALHPGRVDCTDLQQFKSWAVSVIQALPTIHNIQGDPMGIAERARDALRPNNSIEGIFEPPPTPAKHLHGASPAIPPAFVLPMPATAQATSPQRAQSGKQAAYITEPQSIAKKYYVEEKNGERSYFDDYKRSALAMRATDTLVTSKREDLNTIRSMLEIAQARGWQSIEIRGTAEFRREAWIEATAQGIEARGFEPSDSDRQEADRRRGERGPANEIRTQNVPAQAPKADTQALPKDTQAVLTQSPKINTQAPSKDAQAQFKGNLVNSSSADNRKVVRNAEKELSQDGRLILAALSEKIDRQMNKHNNETKVEMKAFVATELVKKERAEGPIVLSAEQKRVAAAPEPTPFVPKSAPALAVAQRVEPEAPRRTLSR
jgi:Large polyvalent protein-associated domain 7